METVVGVDPNLGEGESVTMILPWHDAIASSNFPLGGTDGNPEG